MNPHQTQPSDPNIPIVQNLLDQGYKQLGFHDPIVGLIYLFTKEKEIPPPIECLLVTEGSIYTYGAWRERVQKFYYGA